MLCFAFGFVGVTYGADGSNTVNGAHTAVKHYANTCSNVAPSNVKNNSTFKVLCVLSSNSPVSTISIKSDHGGILKNKTDAQLSPRPYTGAYTLNNLKDTLADTTSDAANANVTKNWTKTFDIATKLDGGDQTQTLQMTHIGTFTIDDGGATGDNLDTIYVGTYFDKIHYRITHE